jgi:hypothetical protein
MTLAAEGAGGRAGFGALQAAHSMATATGSSRLRFMARWQSVESSRAV